MTTITKILFRADGNEKIGLGHVYRCLAIAEYLEGDFEIEFIASKNCTNIKKIIPWDFDLRILLEFDSIMDEARYLAKQYERQKVIFVVDGYQFTTDYLKVFKDFNIPLVYIDDKHEIEIHADLIFNHAAGFTRKDFNTDLLTNICIGPEFAILRKPFLESERKPEFEYEVLICFGGADPDNHTMRVLKDMPKDLKVAVLVGRAYQHMSELRGEVLGMESATFFSGLTSHELADLMERSKRAIMSASSVAYEYITASAGQLYIIQTANNQEYLFNYLVREGAAKKYEGTFDPNFVSKPINDGKSPERILAAFKNLELESETGIVKAREADIMRVFEWANDPLVRQQSYFSNAISLDEHKAWYEKKLNDPNCYYYLVSHAGHLVGQIRFDIKDGVALIGFLVDPAERGKGWGRIILKKGILRLLSEAKDVKMIKGFVKNSNIASKISFIKCNFDEETTNEYEDSVLYTLKV